MVIADLRVGSRGPLVTAAKEAGIMILEGHAITKAHGGHRVARVEISAVNEGASEVIGDTVHMDCDLIAMSGGMSPAVHLHSQARGKLRWDEQTLCFRPSKTHEASINVGACNGSFGLEKAMEEGMRAGRAVAAATGYKAGDGDTLPVVDTPKQSWRPIAAWKITNGEEAGKGPKAFVDFQNDVTASDVALAAREGYQSVEHLKRYTTMGMATDQGKTSNINALAILADTLGSEIPEVGTALPHAILASCLIRPASPVWMTGTGIMAPSLNMSVNGCAPGITRKMGRPWLKPSTVRFWQRGQRQAFLTPQPLAKSIFAALMPQNS